MVSVRYLRLVPTCLLYTSCQAWGIIFKQATTGLLHDSNMLLLHVIFIQAIIKPFYLKYLLFILFQTLINLNLFKHTYLYLISH